MNLYRLKKKIRNLPAILFCASAVYNFIMLNGVKGRKGLKFNHRGAFLSRTKIVNTGNNNTIRIGEGCRIYNSKISFYGDNNLVEIAPDCEIRDLDLYISDGGKVSIGKNTYFTGKIHLACTEGKDISIGERCLFSNEIVFRTGDSHSILDSNEQRINFASDIVIGNHVWIGQQVVVLKGACIGDNSVVGTRALVTGHKFDCNSLLVGTPAKCVKTDISWDHRLL